MGILKCGVVGLGRIGWSTHCKEINERDDMELTCVVDPITERCQEAITTFKTKAFSTIEEAISNLDLDLLVTASPSKFHTEMTIKALNAGINISLNSIDFIEISSRNSSDTSWYDSKYFFSLS